MLPGVPKDVPMALRPGMQRPSYIGSNNFIINAFPPASTGIPAYPLPLRDSFLREAVTPSSHAAIPPPGGDGGEHSRISRCIFMNINV